jgi:hypothetical protein
MNPDLTNSNKTKFAQYVTLVILVLILGVMVAGYIYYGMYYVAPVAEVIEPEVTPVESDTMDAEKRKEIMDALGKTAPEVDEETKAEIIKDLGVQTSETLSESENAERAEIIKALQ